QRLTVEEGGRRWTLSFRVIPKDYPEQHISLADRRRVSPPARDLPRIRREAAALRAAFARWREAPRPPLALRLPVQAPVSSPFGLRRFFNGLPRRPHSGLDLAAPAGTPVRAPAPGRVTLAAELFFNGKTVVLDHGQGMQTLYCHLRRIAVAPGQQVGAGQVLGEVGATGRATGPHLHWSVSLNGARVDPALFLAPAQLAAIGLGP
ncbi:MAG: M23 family metallopeptidase, partial [Gammaproteobacteria bacterium]